MKNSKRLMKKVFVGLSSTPDEAGKIEFRSEDSGCALIGDFCSVPVVIINNGRVEHDPSETENDGFFVTLKSWNTHGDPTDPSCPENVHYIANMLDGKRVRVIIEILED